ncbi:MAG: hypothetical protein WD096_01995 [Actinomycetota bacterium]
MMAFKALDDPAVRDRIRRAEASIRSGQGGAGEGLTAEDLDRVIQHLKQRRGVEDQEPQVAPEVGLRPPHR